MRLESAPNFVADLEHWHYDTFQIHWRSSVVYDFPRGFVTFTIDKDAKTDQLKIDQPNETVSGFTNWICTAQSKSRNNAR